MTNLAESGAVPRAIDARDWLPDLAAFIIGLALTWGFHWQVPDLVWSLWLSSFVIGYVTILITIARGA